MSTQPESRSAPGPENSAPDNSAPDNSAERITEEQREQTLVRLRTATADGLLSLDEFGERTASILAATTQGDLTAAVADLPADVPAAPKEGKTSGLIAGIFGGGDRKGPWRLPQRCLVINVFGGADLDLREASVTGPTSEITVLSLFGGSHIYVPPGIAVDADGFAIFGSNDVDLSGLHPQVGAPAVRIRSYSLFGGTDVTVRLPR